LYLINGKIVKKKGINIIILVATALMMCLTGCSDIQKVKEINVTSLTIEKISPAGLRGLDVYLAAGIDNPSIQIGLTEINGSLTHSGKVLGRLAMDPVTIYGKSAEIYHLKANVSLDKEATFRDLMLLTDPQKLYECMVNISVRAVLKNGMSIPIELKDIPLKKLLNSENNETTK
jgi:hypothetical protein